MGLTYSVDQPEVYGRHRRVRGTLTFDSSYPTGGEAFAPTSVGLVQLTELVVRPGIGASTVGYVPTWDRSVSAPKVLVMMGDNNNASDGPLIQVADTTDLSALVIPFEAVGY